MIRCFSRHDDVIEWKHFPRYWPFVWGIHRSLVNSPHKGQWRGALMYSLICALHKWLSKQSWGWWHQRVHCDVIVMLKRPVYPVQSISRYPLKPQIFVHLGHSAILTIFRHIYQCSILIANSPTARCGVQTNRSPYCTVRHPLHQIPRYAKGRYIYTKTKLHALDLLRWRHNGRNYVSNHQPRHCLLNRLFIRRSKKIPMLRVTGLCAGNSPVTGEFPAQMASNAENVSIWWRHHVWYIPRVIQKVMWMWCLVLSVSAWII